MLVVFLRGFSVDHVVFYGITQRFLSFFFQDPYSVEPVLSGQPKFSGHSAIPVGDQVML